MALPSPVEMPNPLPVNRKKFDLTYIQSVSPAGSQFMQTIERAPPMWVAEYQTPPLTPERDQQFQAFLDSLEGSMVPFLGFDPRRSRPYAYRGTAGTPWLNTIFPYTSVKVVYGDYDNSRLVLFGFSPGAIITAGDYISWSENGRWFLYRARETMAADARGALGPIKVHPRPENFVNIKSARLDRACCGMKILGKVTKDDQVSDVGPVYSFQAVQFKDRSVSAYAGNLLAQTSPIYAQLTGVSEVADVADPTGAPFNLNWLRLSNTPSQGSIAYQSLAVVNGQHYVASTLVYSPSGTPIIHADFNFRVGGYDMLTTSGSSVALGGGYYLCVGTILCNTTAVDYGGLLRHTFYTPEATKALKFGSMAVAVI